MQKEFGLCCERGAVSHATTRPDMMMEDISSCDMSELPHSVSQQLQQRSLNLRTRYSHPAVAHPVCVRHSALSDSPFPSPSATQHRPLRASKDSTRARSPFMLGLGDIARTYERVRILRSLEAHENSVHLAVLPISIQRVAQTNHRLEPLVALLLGIAHSRPRTPPPAPSASPP